MKKLISFIIIMIPLNVSAYVPLPSMPSYVFSQNDSPEERRLRNTEDMSEYREKMDAYNREVEMERRIEDLERKQRGY